MRETPQWNFSLTSHATLGLVDAYDREVLGNSLKVEHPDPPFAAWFVRRGCVSVRFTDAPKARAITARRGEWLLLPSRPRVHLIESGTRLLSIRMTLERADGSALLDGRKFLRLKSANAPHLIPAVTRLARLVMVCRAPGGDETELCSELKLRAAFLDWIGLYLAIASSHGWKLVVTKPTSPVITSTLEWIARQGYAHQLRQEAMASATGTSLSHLKRIFHHELHTSPAAWWQRRRLKEASRQLRTTKLPLKAIAIELGFRFPSHFSAWFRQRTGTSPLEYRRKPQSDV